MIDKLVLTHEQMKAAVQYYLNKVVLRSDVVVGGVSENASGVFHVALGEPAETLKNDVVMLKK